MKRTCDNCKAEQVTATCVNCALGYRVKTIARIKTPFPILTGIPQEECPKPKTLKAFCSLLRSKAR